MKNERSQRKTMLDVDVDADEGADADADVAGHSSRSACTGCTRDMRIIIVSWPRPILGLLYISLQYILYIVIGNGAADIAVCLPGPRSGRPGFGYRC